MDMVLMQRAKEVGYGNIDTGREPMCTRPAEMSTIPSGLADA